MQSDQSLTDHLRKHVEQLAGDIGPRNVFVPEALERAARYIESEWTDVGYAVDRLVYDVSGIRCANLAAARAGRSRRTEILLIGAHYDSVLGCPGANDNASGVAALLEISRLFRTVEPELRVHFVAFVNEEPPFFLTGQQGSVVYAQAARRRGDDIRLMASLETIGRPRPLERAHGWSPCGSCKMIAQSPAQPQNGPRSGTHPGASDATIRSAKAKIPEPGIVRGSLESE